MSETIRGEGPVAEERKVGGLSVGKATGGRRILSLVRKELLSYLHAPAFYGAAVFFLAFTSAWLFHLSDFLAVNVASMRHYFAAFPLAFVLVVPVLTMRSWAEERKTGSVELLLTMPFSEWDLVLAKFISSYALLAGMIALTIPVPLTLIPLGNFDAGVIAAEYLGALLMGASAVALGLLLSCLSRNQAGAFLATATALLLTMLAGPLVFGMGLPYQVGRLVNFLSLPFHFEGFSRGLLDSRPIVHFLSGTFLFLFLSTRVILRGKWGKA